MLSQGNLVGEMGPNRLTWSIRAAVVACAMLISVISAQAPALAVCYVTDAWTSTAAGSSQTFQIANGGNCNDLNAAFTHSSNDFVLGWYLDSGVWTAGSLGYVAVDTVDGQPWPVLLTNIVNGATVRGETWSFSQTVRYVH